MSVIIRLQNLPWSANALDIRQYFRGLSIPEGGVHIVGGELGDAFIAFSTDEDARQAFNMNGGKIKEVQIKLLLSSRTEMQKVIEAARNPTPFMQVVAPQPLTLPAQVASVLTNLVESKTDSKNSLTRDDKSTEKKSRRSRSRSRERRDRRDRSRDRSRDRKDRRRRDRSRSRDRRDRHRRDRSRSRNRSRTNDRSRSRDRDPWRGRDKKKEPSEDKLNGGDVSSTSTTNTDIIECTGPIPAPATSQSVWDVPQLMSGKSNLNNPARNNLPSLMNSFDQNRRSASILPMAGPIDVDKHVPGDFRNRDSWPPTNQSFNDIRFQNQGMNQQGMNFRDSDRSSFNNRGKNFDSFGSDNRFGNMSGNNSMSRPLLNRPINLTGAPFSPYDSCSMDSNSSMGQNERSNDSYHRDSKPKIPRSGCCVKMHLGRGGYGDVRRFFQGLFIANDGVKLVNDEDGRRTGIAYVRFVQPEGKREALQRSGTSYRGNSVEITHCDDSEFDNAIDSYVPPQNREIIKDDRPLDRASIYGENIIRNVDDKLSCIAVLNLPPYTKEHDIITMVGDFQVVSVLMVMNKDSQQLAYLQFTKSDDALRFYNMKDKHYINGKSITIQLVSENIFFEVKRQHNSGSGIVDIPDEASLASKGTSSNDSPVSDCVVLKGLPQKTCDRDIIDFFSDIGLIPSRIHVPFGKSSKQSFCYCEFSEPSQALQALTKNGTQLGMSEVIVELIPRREMEQLIGITPSPENRFNNSSNGHNNQISNRNINGPRRPLLSGPPSQRQQQTASPQYVPEAFRNPGCVLSLENVPFRAGVSEILDFFRDFHIPEENVMRRFNDRGHPTGDARVAFSSPLEAQRAFSELRHCKIRDRTIFMHLQ
ncbi:uncharacterized protein LOC123296960 [Chrysoperla carnea]|uniref:uncharacterized protein LOC123296960 n=1 Tax=Chrysoperla carnea TaxID=189513 RepID=UPI001D064124|nr:uncharacterized protein LOC123296960 [Chrysoperla carnea]